MEIHMVCVEAERQRVLLKTCCKSWYSSGILERSGVSELWLGLVVQPEDLYLELGVICSCCPEQRWLSNQLHKEISDSALEQKTSAKVWLTCHKDWVLWAHIADTQRKWELRKLMKRRFVVKESRTCRISSWGIGSIQSGYPRVILFSRAGHLCQLAAGQENEYVAWY